MSKRRKTTGSGAMLELWRPPQGAGEPVGCLATTFTFSPALFEEQCLARFLEIESEPNREDLAFLLEREKRLGSAYAAVLADYTQAGKEHSLRWDVLPVRIRGARQHAKISLLAWARHIRIIVASANLTEQGYRTNQEVAAAVDLTPSDGRIELFLETVSFLRSLLAFVPGAAESPPEIRRAEDFLGQVGRHAGKWGASRRRDPIRQHLVFTLPAAGGGGRSSLGEAVQACRARGASPREAWVASPFFDTDATISKAAAELCKLMARGGQRRLRVCVPSVHSGDSSAVPRLAAPKSLMLTPPNYSCKVTVEKLPGTDPDRNQRPWHAKMIAFLAEPYTALMIGSSNFTCAGLGLVKNRNAEANLLTIVDRAAYARESGQLEAVWPDVSTVAEPDKAEWLGSPPEENEGGQDAAPALPPGFLSALYRGGTRRTVVLRLDAGGLPEEWCTHACGQDARELLTSTGWAAQGRPSAVGIPWEPPHPPEKVLVRWAGHEAFLPLNVEDSRHLPPPPRLEHMSAEDMLLIVAAADPGTAFRAWAKQQQPPDAYDEDLDSATPSDLDPLRRYDLQATFLHRVRRRARILGQLRAHLQRPVWSLAALDWRLRGLLGVSALAERLVRDFENADGKADEVLLTLADFLLVLREVDYRTEDGSLPKAVVDDAFRAFLSELAEKLRGHVEARRSRLSEELLSFWERVLDTCRR
ncbi:MAG TPA: hypothetical protein PLD73_05690 [Candidatus Hydrogenedentes bacterium]|jgi:hypothetical protein|nr:hypothetical protein [Candidatus Hydrogenedentota bacterium]HOS77684.1 hypothetical protein [Syntrophales bacterium]